MGSSSYDGSVFRARADHHKAAGTDAFTHTDDIRTGRTATGVHALLDPSKKNKAGKLIRESFDSVAHPTSNAVAVLFDVTGSMASVPRLFIETLGTLMATLTKKGYLNDPQVLFGAVGDAFSDNVPLQVGQFEAGNEMDEALSKIYLEGGGGGSMHESYELGMYYMARHTDLNCVEKRHKKGYLFITGDELPYDVVSKKQVKEVIGDSLQADIPIAEILTELREKFEVFWIMPGGTSHWGRPAVEKPLREMFGQNFIKMENPSNICEVICATIAVFEGHDLEDVSAAMVASGSNETKVTAALGAVSALAAAKNLSGKGADKVARL
jgi:hypothetical protein